MAEPVQTSEGRVGDGTRLWAGCAVILLACFVAFGPALGGGLVWDDDTHLLDNPVFDENGLYKVWLSPPERINYWPLAWTSYWVEYQLWGFDPPGYHVVNVLIHVATSILVWRILASIGVPFGWLAALVFAVHPVNVESVAWIAQRKNLLSFLFFALSLFFYVRFEAHRAATGYLASLLCFAGAMLSKGAAAPLPLVLLLLAWWRRGAIMGRDVGLALPFFGVALLGALLEVSGQILVAGPGSVVVRDHDFAARLAGSGWVWWFYLSKALLPIDLNFVYPRWEIDATRVVTWLPLLGVACVYGAAWWKRRGVGRPVLFALVYFGLLLTPVLGFFDIYFMRFSYVADHYQYLALPGAVALVVCGAGALWGGPGTTPGKPFLAASGIVVASAIGASAALSATYQSAEVLWRATLEKNPDTFLGHYNLGHLLQLEDRLDQAAEHYREALRLDPEYAATWNNLGRILQDESRVPEAIEHFRRAIALDAEHLEAHNNLGLLLARQGDTAAAIAHYEAALRIAPDTAAVHYNLGLLLERTGRIEEARARYRRVLQIDPRAQYARRRLARLRAARGGAPAPEVTDRHP